MEGSAARKIQRAWRRTSTRIGRLGTAFNENLPLNQLRNVPLSRLYKILLHQARRANQNWRYELRANGLYDLSGPVPFRMTRPAVIQNISQWTNMRQSPARNRAALTIQKYRKAQTMKRRLALIGSLRLPANIKRRVLSV